MQVVVGVVLDSLHLAEQEESLRKTQIIIKVEKLT